MRLPSFGRFVLTTATLVAIIAPVLATRASVHAQAPATSATPTFTRNVAPILYQKCVSCHRPGEIAPMSLITYENVRPYARAIRAKVADGAMPPWHADAPAGMFRNDPRLTEAEKQTMSAWASNGAPQGDPRDLPPAPTFTEGWSMGKPDLVLPMRAPFELPASGAIDYQYFEIPTHFTEDKWVQAFEVRAGTPSVVHHVLVFSREPDAPPRAMPFVRRAVGTRVPARAAAPLAPAAPGERGAAAPSRLATTSAPRGGALVGRLAPGTPPQVFPPGQAMLIRAGAVLTLQMHYTAIGKATTDRSSVGIIFAKEPPQQEVRNGQFLNANFTIPPGASEHRVDEAIEFTADSHIMGLIPHSHLRGKRWEYRLVQPDGSSQVVLSVPRYDFNWQTYYEWATPLAAPKGSRLEASAYYDNSSANKANPDPTAEVHWGDQTWDEMHFTAITFTVDGQKPATTAQRQP
jgi:hypothetical protein